MLDEEPEWDDDSDLISEGYAAATATATAEHLLTTAGPEALDQFVQARSEVDPNAAGMYAVASG